ncbi:hypothetical protein E1284_18540 [Actinomadura bangladeshensis]|uniref:Uncharacterized protein n=1 Tax=Actinomadura bangladeshensis TaxID=453573 RepID=A0A4R4NVU1_9ACTN|nr:hypothetical protein E1284_18540 [Actinomadura bangladeshensis]
MQSGEQHVDETRVVLDRCRPWRLHALCLGARRVHVPRRHARRLCPGTRRATARVAARGSAL